MCSSVHKPHGVLPGRPWDKLFKWVACLALPLMMFASHAHELVSNRATLVLRDGHQLTVTLFINYVDALHKTLTPKLSFEEFLLVHAAMTPAEFQQAAARAHSQLEADTRLTGQDGKALVLSNWRWPVTAAVHSALQQRAMQIVVDGLRDHRHEPVVEVQSEASFAAEPKSVTLKLPDTLKPVLIVSYKPTQVWMDPAADAKTVKF